MTKLYRSLIAIALSFMCAFVTIGYAAVADTLLISGTATIQLEGLYITDVQVKDTTGNGGEGTYEYYQTNFGSKIPASTSSVTYQITITNYGPTAQVYSKVEWGANDAYNNTLLDNGTVKIDVAKPQVVDANGNTSESRVVDVGEKIILTVTYTNSANAYANTYVNFFFGTSVESAGTAATNAVFDKFEDILNNPESFSDLTSELEDAGTLEWWERLLGNWFKTRDYIGNVADSALGEMASDEKALVNSLFGESGLVLELYDENGNKVEQEVLVIIQYKDVTGDGVKDMILYMTSEHIYSETNPITERIAIDDIYAAIFICNTTADGTVKWAQIGDMYTGTALAGRINQGGELNTVFGSKVAADSFDPDTWTDVGETITVTDTYSYTVAANTTMPTLASMLASSSKLTKKTGATTTDEVNALTELNALYTKAGEILADSKLTGTAVDQLREAYTNATTALTAGKGKGAGNALTFLEAVTCIKELEYALKPF